MKLGERFFRDEPDKYIAIKTNSVLRGISISRQGNEWRMIAKITDNRGNHMVAFIVCATIYDCWEYWYLHYTTTSAPLRWSVDKFAK